MNDEQSLSVLELLGFIRRNLFRSVVMIVVCLGNTLILIDQLPKKYKSSAVLTIQSAYFRNPLVSDLLTEVTDQSELNAQRQALLRLSLSDRFLDTLGERYGLFESAARDPHRVLERELLLKQIEYFSVSPTSFQISLRAKDPNRVYHMTRDVLYQMTLTLIEQRYRILVKARDAIQVQVEFLSRALTELKEPAQSEFLKQELAKINASIDTLRAKFTEDHPDLVQLKQRAETVKKELSVAPPPVTIAHDDMSKAFLTQNSKQPVQDIFNDLLKKLSHLNIVLEMEKDHSNVSYLSIIEEPTVPVRPIFPDPRIFIPGGLVVGVLLALIQSIFYELKRNREVLPESLGEILDAPLLGTLPLLKERAELLMLGNDPVFRPLGLPGRATT